MKPQSATGDQTERSNAYNRAVSAVLAKVDGWELDPSWEQGNETATDGNTGRDSIGYKLRHRKHSESRPINLVIDGSAFESQDGEQRLREQSLRSVVGTLHYLSHNGWTGSPVVDVT